MNNQTSTVSVSMPYHILMMISVASYFAHGVFDNILTGILFVLSNTFLTFIAVCFVVAIFAILSSEVYREKIKESKEKAMKKNKFPAMVIFNMVGTLVLFLIADHYEWVYSSTLCAVILISLAVTHLVLASLTSKK